MNITADKHVQRSRGPGAEENSFLPGIEIADDASDTSAVKICLLDDDPSVLKSTGRLLSSMGLGVESFTDPLAFLQYAERGHPRVVILDVGMPVMDGLEVQERLHDISPSTRVIILTSKDNDEVRNRAMQGGAAAFFSKPVDDDALLAAIKSNLNGN